MSKRLSSLSVFFPCFNEEKNVQQLVEQTLYVLPQVTDNFEIILVNDGSRDKTGEIADEIANKDPRIKAIHHSVNQGYGGAVRSGFLASTKDWVFFSDGDLQFDLSELKSFIDYTESYDAVIGYRIKRAEGFGRARNAYLFKIFINMLFQVNVRDIDCAFKLIKNSYMQNIRLVSTGAMISTELLFKLKSAGARRKELPVNHFLRQYGTQTGASFKVILKAGYESFKLFYKTRLTTPVHRKVIPLPSAEAPTNKVAG